jgi:hypothetical protein
LPAAESDTTRADESGVTVWKRGDEFVNLSRLACFFDCFIGGKGVVHRERNVISYRAFVERGLLGDKGEVLSIRLGVNLGDVCVSK